MLNQETKRRIDSARDILVGKVPDPKAQVEQITTAMIYKFMDDMDKEAQEVGGKSKFFTNGYEKYSWTNVLDPKLGGQERLNIYGEAISKMQNNPYIPQLFRDIFKDAFLPYRSPETLSMFLKEINGFKYLHSEDLGDAFEYLLSILGSQGDAGQFRTPRHIIDFIVDVVDPKKEDTILDPACGTAGFLVSSFKHIVEANKEKLSPEDKKRMMNNIVGYDISPDMVKLSKVNMYLHGFPTPHIFEYDTLSSEEKWDETYDVIMANPPFMSPKGGIKPHKRFSVQANRAEVLFVNYIMEHLNINGRAGIIVPEGIIFQSGNAYKQLRKMLINDNYLYAVVSLPAGVFQPYSGVKTSILFIDKNISKKVNHILFINISSDGFESGAQRRPSIYNDLPLTLEAISKYINNSHSNGSYSIGGWPEGKFNIDTYLNCQFVSKNELGNNGDYNLSIERYKKIEINLNRKWSILSLGEICDLQSGSRQKGGAIKNGVPSIGGEQISKEGDIKFNKMKYVSEEHFKRMNSGILIKGDVLVVKDGATTGKTGLYFGNNTFERAAVNEHVFILRCKKNIIPHYLYNVIKSEEFQIRLKSYIKGIIGGISLEIKNIEIPVPTIQVQKEITKITTDYQKIIDGARMIINTWKPSFVIDSKWQIKKVNEICTLVRGSSPRPQGDRRYYGGEIPRLMVADLTRDGMYVTPKLDFLTEEGAKLSRPMSQGEVVMAVSGNPGLPAILKINACIHDGFVGFRNLDKNILPEFFYFILLYQKNSNYLQSTGAVFKNLNTDQIKNFKIPIPSIQNQKQIIGEIMEEQKIIEANKRIIEIFNKKIEEKINEIWND